MTDHRRRRTDGARILVVEDNEDFRLLLELTLQDAGYVVESAGSSEDAITLLRESGYDLVLSDYSLPGYSGAWLVSQVSTPSFLITGDPDAPGIPDHLPVFRKPLDFDHFLTRVRTAIGGVGSLPAAPQHAAAPESAGDAMRRMPRRPSRRSTSDEPSSAM
jgi:DNA-binding NtrC family response regulator